ncbi:hypothetical protein DEJ25_07790 [Curtobacterium sp. MCPF17_011]|nr:hypothetical protein DEJ25_07790 [Curtobacterium sp. MCPF17_011]
MTWGEQMVDIEYDDGDVSTGTRHRRLAAALLMLTLFSGAVAGCAQHTTPGPQSDGTPVVDSESAQQRIVEVVDDATERLGGDWRVRSGPDYAEACELRNGDRGAEWTFFVTRAQIGDVAADVAKVEARWREQGMSVDRWGTKTEPTVVGRGGDRTDSISFSVAPDLYVIQSVSLCFPGDADEL